MARKTVSFPVAAAIVLAASNVFASIQFDAVDQNVTNEVIYGSGNANGGFAVSQNPNTGVELGLRTHVRFPTPLNVFNSNGDGTYTYPAGNFGVGGTDFAWNFDWSINTNYNGAGVNVGSFFYELRIDFDPSAATSYLTFDPIAVGGDHSFGTNATGNGAGLEAPGDDTYANLIANNNLAQNSWRHTFFGAVDPTADGVYDIELSAYRGERGALFHLATVGIQVINGAVPDGAVPEPAAVFTWGCLALTAGGFWLRRNKAA